MRFVTDGIKDRVISQRVAFHIRRLMSQELRIRRLLRDQKFFQHLRNMRKLMLQAPLATCGAMVFAAVIANLAVCSLMNRPLGYLGLAIRGVLLFLGIMALRNKEPWHAIRETSRAVRMVDSFRSHNTR